MAFFGGHQRKAFAKVKTRLVAKYAPGTGARAVALVGARFNDMPEQLKILLHGLQVKLSCKTTEAWFLD